MTSITTTGPKDSPASQPERNKEFNRIREAAQEKHAGFTPGQRLTQLQELRDPVGLGPVPVWSFSTLKQFEACKYSVYLSKVAKMPRPPESRALIRGNRIHDGAEKYVKGEIDELPKELENFAGSIERLREQYLEGIVEVEGNWGFTADWEPCTWKDKALWCRMKLDVLLWDGDDSAYVIDYKGLPLDTPIPTPKGWTTMGAIKVGDYVLDIEGHPAKVKGKSSIKYMGNYEITFDDTSTVTCDEEHLWRLYDGTVVPITELRKNDYLPLAEPLKLPEVKLPIDPYLLGYWLGDGKHSSGEITLWKEDYKEILPLLGEIRTKPPLYGNCYTPTILGLRKKLRLSGLLENKHIPAIYMRASFDQRLQLLRGLMDSDGTANALRKQAIFCSGDENLSLQVKELLLTLGQRPLLNYAKATGFGKTVHTYNISFRPQREEAVFTLQRKKTKTLGWGPGRSNTRRVKKIELVESVHTQCINVDSPTHTFLCTDSFIPTHNSGKKFGNEIKHTDQGLSYAIGSIMRYTQLKTVQVEFWYTDKKETLKKLFNRNQLQLLIPHLEERAHKMTSCKTFEPSPSVHTCRFCDHRETGSCSYAATL